MCSVCVVMNWSSDCEVRSVVRFLTIENNSGARIHRCLCAAYAWFTFSLRQHKTRQEQECEGYTRLIFHFLNLFSSGLEALGDMLVNQS